MSPGIHYRETEYGFEYGAAEITRAYSHEGRVTILLKTPKQELQLYVTKTGKVRVFGRDGEWETTKGLA